MNIKKNKLLFAKIKPDSDAKIPYKRDEDGWYDFTEINEKYNT